MNVIRIRIDKVEKKYEESDDGWINQQIDRRRDDGQIVCVQVNVKTPEIDMILSTPTCAGNCGGSRAPNRREQEIFSLWDKQHLNQDNFSSGSVCTFLKQLVRAI